MVSRQEIMDGVVEILKDTLGLEESRPVDEDSKIVDDLGADSLDIVDVVQLVEKKFVVKVPDADIENLKTVGDVVDFIEGQKA